MIEVSKFNMATLIMCLLKCVCRKAELCTTVTRSSKFPRNAKSVMTASVDVLSTSPGLTVVEDIVVCH